MFANRGRYIVIASGLAIVVTAVVQTIYTAITGMALSSTLPGLAVSMGLFIVVTLAVYAYYARKMGGNQDQLLMMYDEGCDPQTFVEGAKSYAEAIPMPYIEPSAWYMSYYAQALLDLGRVQEAQKIEQNMYDSVKLSSSVDVQAKIIVNLVPLALKLLGPADTLPIMNKGLELLATCKLSREVSDMEAYLQNQVVLATATAEGDDEKLVRFYASTRNNPQLPLRIRVEQAWEEAKIHYRSGDIARETECLEFVVRNGNKLALVKPANDRLIAIS